MYTHDLRKINPVYPERTALQPLSEPFRRDIKKNLYFIDNTCLNPYFDQIQTGIYITASGGILTKVPQNIM